MGARLKGERIQSKEAGETDECSRTFPKTETPTHSPGMEAVHLLGNPPINDIPKYLGFQPQYSAPKPLELQKI